MGELRVIAFSYLVLCLGKGGTWSLTSLGSGSTFDVCVVTTLLVMQLDIQWSLCNCFVAKQQLQHQHSRRHRFKA